MSPLSYATLPRPPIAVNRRAASSASICALNMAWLAPTAHLRRPGTIRAEAVKAASRARDQPGLDGERVLLAFEDSRESSPDRYGRGQYPVTSSTGHNVCPVP